MKEICNLTKVLFKNNFFSTKNKSKVGKTILYLFLVLYFSGIMGFFSFEAIVTLKQINQEAVYINLCFLMSIGFTIFRSIFTTLNVLYFSKDTEYLLPFPIKPKNILVAKLNILLIYEYITELFLVFIPMAVYGVIERVEFSYYIIMLLIFLLLPLVPILISSFLIILIMRFTNIIKNKDFVQYISVFLVLVLVIAIQFVTSNANAEITETELMNMLSKTNGTIEMFSKYFITLAPAMNSIVNFNNIEGLKNILIFIIETFVIYYIMINISSKFYIRGLVGVNSGAGKKSKKLEKGKIRKEKTAISYIKKELKILCRNPIYFMQCILPSILFPIIFLLPVVLNINNLDSLDMAEISVIKEAINMPFGFMILLCFIEFIFAFNFISLTAISRDRHNATFMKYIPVSLHKQCIYKIIPSVILNFIPIILVLTFAVIFLNLKPLLVVLASIIAILLNVFESYLMIIVDLKRPKLEWTTEYAVVKQNINMLYQMIFGTIIILLFIALGSFVSNILTIFMITIALFIIGVYSVNAYIKKNEAKLFAKIN